MIYRLANAPVRPYPFPHFFVADVFPADLYARLRRHLPPVEAYLPIAESGEVSSFVKRKEEIYPERFVIQFEPDEFARMRPDDRAVWGELAEWLLGDDFLLLILSKFDTLLRQRFGDSLGSLRFSSTAQLLRDFTDYSLGPHSDHPSKVLVLLFYLPETADAEHLGTSIYLAHNPEEHDDTGRHFPREKFSLAATMPYRPNCAAGFFKTPNSFHGVERVTGPMEQRDLIQFAIRYAEQPG